VAENLEKALPNKNKLYRVTFFGNGFKDCYVVASDPTTAQDKVIVPMIRDNFGYSSGRVIKTIELIAEDYLYTNVGAYLFV